MPTQTPKLFTSKGKGAGANLPLVYTRRLYIPLYQGHERGADILFSNRLSASLYFRRVPRVSTPSPS